MKILIFIVAACTIITGTANAQNKTKMQARPSEQKEIRGDNHLGKEQQQKQLRATPERIADSTPTIKALKPVTKKKMVKTKTKNKGI